MTVKVIKLEKWMQYETTRTDTGIRPCNPIFDRDGYYYNTFTKKCWFEVDGEAFDCESSESFLHRLAYMSHRPLRKTERDALIVLANSKLISKEQQKLLEMDTHRLDIRELVLGTKKLRKRITDRMKARTLTQKTTG